MLRTAAAVQSVHMQLQMRAVLVFFAERVTTGSSEHSPTNRRTSGHLQIWICWYCPTSDVPGEGVHLDQVAGRQVILQGEHRQGPEPYKLQM